MLPLLVRSARGLFTSIWKYIPRLPNNVPVLTGGLFIAGGESIAADNLWGTKKNVSTKTISTKNLIIKKELS